MAKKRFTFADAKEKIKDLEDKLAAVNVALDDNVVTHNELKWLKIYKTWFFGSIGFLVLKLIFHIF